MAAVFLALTVVTACGSDGPSAGPSTAISPSAGTGAPTPEPSPDPRSPEALAQQFVFEAPPAPEPAVQEALAAYADFVQQFVVAQGLGQLDYPPLLARIEPSDRELKDFLLLGLKRNVENGQYLLGGLTERVTEAAGGPDLVVIDTCTDYRDRKVYRQDSETLVGDLKTPFNPVRARVVMTPGRGGWLVSQYSVPNEQNCP